MFKRFVDRQISTSFLIFWFVITNYRLIRYFCKMKAVSIKQIKDELKFRRKEDLEALLLRLGRFKAENKELLTYLLFNSQNESGYIESIKSELEDDFTNINTNSPFYIKKSLRKMIRKIRKFSRYSNYNETEIELYLYFARKIRDYPYRLLQHSNILKIYQQQITHIKNKLPKLHQDLQYDFKIELEELIIN